MASKLPHPPPPLWSGVQKGALAAVKRLPAQLNETFGAAAIERTEGEIHGLEEEAKRQSHIIRSWRGSGHNLDAEREELRATQHELRLAKSLLKQLRAGQGRAVGKMTGSQLFGFLLGLPGMLGVRVEDGIPILLVRTRYAFRGAHFDFGDYEIALDPSFPKPRERRVRYSHLNLTSGLYPDGAGFCFGDRHTEVIDLWVGLQPGQAVHLMVACMNDVNEEDRRYDRIAACATRIAKKDPALEVGPHHPYQRS